MSTDQYDRVKGWLPYTKRKEDPRKMYWGVTLFVDHASVNVSVFNQVSLGSSGTVLSKEIYRGQAADMGILIKKYHGDNGVYLLTNWKRDIILCLIQELEHMVRTELRKEKSKP